MCTLAVLRNVSKRYPLVVAANRDEHYARPTAPPARLADMPAVVAGRDLLAGGTWLGGRAEGGRVLVAGLLNRRPPGRAASVAGELSRGMLCLDMLRCRSVREALALLERHEVGRYGSFNLLLADLNCAVVAHNTGGLVTAEIDDGLSLLTNLELNDARCPRLASAVPAFERIAASTAALDPAAEEIVELTAPVLASHENSLDSADSSPFSRLCVHAEGYGTRSSSILLAARDATMRYFHAPGPPCRTAFVEVTG
jgi:uncharacterized protein with NRDE domain